MAINYSNAAFDVQRWRVRGFPRERVAECALRSLAPPRPRFGPCGGAPERRFVRIASSIDAIALQKIKFL